MKTSINSKPIKASYQKLNIEMHLAICSFLTSTELHNIHFATDLTTNAAVLIALCLPAKSEKDIENQKILFVGHNPIRRAFCSKLMKTIEAQIQKSICSPFSDIPHKIGGLLFLAKIKNTTIDIPRNLIRRDYFRDEDDRTLPKGLSILINDFMPDSTTPFMPYTMAVLRGFPHPYMERYPNVYRPTHTNLTLSSEEITDHLGKIISLISSDDLSTTAIAWSLLSRSYIKQLWIERL